MTDKRKERDMGRRVITYIREDHFLDALCNKVRIINLPDDALFLQAGYCPERQGFYVVIQSNEFAKSNEGEILPEFIMEITRV